MGHVVIIVKITDDQIVLPILDQPPCDRKRDRIVAGGIIIDLPIPEHRVNAARIHRDDRHIFSGAGKHIEQGRDLQNRLLILLNSVNFRGSPGKDRGKTDRRHTRHDRTGKNAESRKILHPLEQIRKSAAMHFADRVRAEYQRFFILSHAVHQTLCLVDDGSDFHSSASLRRGQPVKRTDSRSQISDGVIHAIQLFIRLKLLPADLIHSKPPYLSVRKVFPSAS